MKLEIFGGTKETEDVLRLKLAMNGVEVQVIAVDADGKKLPDGILFSFDPNGTFYRHRAIGKAVPVQKDGLGRIVEA